MFNKLLPLLAASTLAAASLPAQITDLYGDYNNTPGDAADVTTPDADFASWMGLSVDFDSVSNQQFGTTVTIPPVRKAKLRIQFTALTALGNTAYLNLRHSNSPWTFDYQAQLAFLTDHYLDLPAFGTGETILLDMKLHELPEQMASGNLFSMIGGMNFEGELDIHINGNVSVDFIEVVYYPADAPSFGVHGSYPGTVRLISTDLTPNAPTYFVWGLDILDSTVTIPEGLVNVDMDVLATVAPGVADANGNMIVPFMLPPTILDFNVHVQAIDGATLTAGSMVTL